MPVFNILGLIPQSLRQQALDTLVDFVSGEAKKFVSGEVAKKIKTLRSDAAFQQAFEKGLERAAARFVEEYEVEDEDLVAAIQADATFFASEQVQQAMLTILKKPGTYLVEDREKLVQSFDAVLPQRKNRERVDKAVTAFLRCLAEELWHLPELRPVYSLQFQRLSAEAAQQQAALQKAQLQALTGVGEDIRAALLELTDALNAQHALDEADRYALPERPKVYQNLPQPDYGRFIGREAELAQVEKILRPYPHSQHALVTIDGIGGIGKSALALEVGHRYLRNFDALPKEERFEAILWTSAKQTVLSGEGISIRRQTLRTLDDIYTAIAASLQREDITRARKEDQDEIVSSALTRQRTLLIVDNLETVDDEAVMSFLRELPAPTKAIVTTRHRLDVAYPVRLSGMPWEDARQLIAQECAKKGVHLPEADAHRLFERTGGVPLAIVWSIAQMGFGYSVEAVLTRLGRPTGDIARFCFEGAVEQISGRPAHQLLMTLSLCADSASRESLGYATELPELDRDDGLVQLEKLSLVNKHGDRFSLLPLTKQYAAAEFEKSSEKERLREKWIEYFRTLSEEYGGEYLKWENYDWLFVEGDNILYILDWAISESLGKIALSFIRSTRRYLQMTGRWIELSEYGEQLQVIAQALNDKTSWAWICAFWLSRLYAVQGKFDLAENLSKRGISLYKELGDIKGMCFAMNRLALVFRLSKEYDAAKEVLEQALDLAKKHDYYDNIIAFHYESGMLARDLGQWKNAKRHLKTVIEWFEEHKKEIKLDFSNYIWSIANLGWAEYNLGNYEYARELMERSFTFFKQMGVKEYNALLCLRLAKIEKTLSNSNKALQYAQESIFWAEQMGIKREFESARALLAELELGAVKLQEGR